MSAHPRAIRSIVSLDIFEANYARIALDSLVEELEPRVGAPHYADIDGLGDYLENCR